MPKSVRTTLPGRKSSSIKRKKQKNTHDNDNKHNTTLLTELTTDNGYFKPTKHTYTPNDNSAKSDILPLERSTNDSDGTTETQYVDPNTTAKILKQVSKQNAELDSDGDEPINTTAVQQHTRKQRRHSISIDMSTVDSDSEDSELDEYIDEQQIDYEIEQLDETELSQFYSTDISEKSQLADKVFSSIQQHTADSNIDTNELLINQVEPQVRVVYEKVGTYLQHYTSGKIPKAFKIIPILRNWEQILYITEPDNWSPQSTYIATKLFTSNLNPKMAQRFYSLILLPKIQANIAKYKKLNYHLYQAVRKTLYKPAAFFKGILLPLAQQCTLRDAVIISSILHNNTIPVLHSAVALMKLCECEYNTATELFIKTLINKKYNLPYRVIDCLVDHFVQCKPSETDTTEQMPVVWHQSLLVFVQRYKHELNPVQIKQLKQLIKKQQHYQITPEIKKELYAPQILDSTKIQHTDHMIDADSKHDKPVVTDY